MKSIVLGFLIQRSGEMSPFEGAPEEFDQIIFAVQKDKTTGPVKGLTLNLVKEQVNNTSSSQGLIEVAWYKT
ncbi:hypothetical protein L1049_027107 [Liquidambar formosana]|uniref:Uncharacterized protein n=1 Tax=Liquidambar formosana TaxID=63359 RepID=A0AAP0QXN7_LIQFO